MTIAIRAAGTAIVVAVAAGFLAVDTHAQQGPAPQPQIPQPIFRAPEDVSKTGVKPEEIKPGEKPDYRRLRDQLVVIPVQGNVFLIGGAGGNVAVQVTDKGTLVVDAGDAAASDRLLAEINKLKLRPVRWIVNTSADPDHTGGNGKIAKTGIGGALGGGGNAAGLNLADPARAGIIASEKALNRMTAAGQEPSRQSDDWPTDTFFTPRKNMSFGGEPIEMWSIPAAHTDGDVMVFFRKSDVIVAGEIISGDRYPMFDVRRGGSMQGILDGLNKIIATAVAEYNQQGGTRVVPGHGRVMNQSDVVEYRDMATIIRERIGTLIKQGKTLEQVKAARPTLDYDGQYGSTSGEWTTDMFIEAIYREITAKLPAAPAKRPAGRSTN